MKDRFVRTKLVAITVVIFLAYGFMGIGSSYSAIPDKAAQAKPPRYGGTLRISDGADAVNPGYPPKLIRAQSNRQAAPAVETLLRTDATGKLVPWLASGVKEDPKGMAITLTLRKGVKFHDGTDFNAEAVKWNLDQCIAAKTQGTESFKSVLVIDTYKVRINLNEWDSTATSNLAQTVGMMISPAAYKKNGEEWCLTHPVGTGPFQFVNWEKDVKISYQKFPDYWQKGKPYLDKIEFVTITDALTREMSFRGGEIDMMMTLVAQSLAKFEKDGYLVARRKVGSGAIALVPDSANANSPFADARVRRAVQHAIDTQALVKTVLSGEAEPTNQYVPKEHWGHDPAVKGYPYSPEKAKQLLTQAGYPNGFKTKITYIAGSSSADQLYVAVQGYLKAVGIDVTLEPTAVARFNQIVFGGKWEGLIHGSVSPNPDVNVALSQKWVGEKWYSQMAAPQDYLKAVHNAQAAPDFKRKQKWTREAMKLMSDKYCLQIFFYCPSEFMISTKVVHNTSILGSPNTATWTPEDAWIDK